MGFESYNLKLTMIKKYEIRKIINIFIDMNYHIVNENILEKITENGFIEILIENDNISIRTAKANSVHIIDDIFNDIKKISHKIPINIFDFQLKQNISLENYILTFDKFSSLQNEFNYLFPYIKFPIRCNDVIM